MKKYAYAVFTQQQERRVDLGCSVLGSPGDCCWPMSSTPASFYTVIRRSAVLFLKYAGWSTRLELLTAWPSSANSAQERVWKLVDALCVTVYLYQNDTTPPGFARA